MKKFTIKDSATNVIFTEEGLKNRVYCVQTQDKYDNSYCAYYYNKEQALKQASNEWYQLCNKDKKDRIISIYKIDVNNIYHIDTDGNFLVSDWDIIKEYSL